MKYLFGIPGAGGGPRELDKNWDRLSDGDLEFRRVLHNNIYDGPESFCTDMEQAAERTADQILELIKEDDSVYLFGHCMGASVAYETASLLEREHGVHVKGLFVATFISPDVPIFDGISDMGEEEFIDEIHSHGTIPEEFFTNRALTKLFMPVVRADYRLIEHYCDTNHYVLDCPIVGFYGEDDDMVRPEETAGWANYTSHEYISRVFPGDHYFYYDSQAAIAGIIKGIIEEIEGDGLTDRDN